MNRTPQDGVAQDSAYTPNDNPPINGGQTAETPPLKFQVSGRWYPAWVDRSAPKKHLNAVARSFEIIVETDNPLAIHQKAKTIIHDKYDTPRSLIEIHRVKAVSNG